MLRSRPECETDENFFQLIPYIMLINQRNEIYCYTRGKAGDEDRLHSKLSIGLGGHVDAAPTPGNLLTLLRAEAARELNEETGILVGNPEVFTFDKYIVDHSDAVGRVHLGLLTSYMVDNLQLVNAELNVIEKGEFRSVENLTRPEVYARLENWSRHVVDDIRNGDWDI